MKETTCCLIVLLLVFGCSVAIGTSSSSSEDDYLIVYVKSTLIPSGNSNCVTDKNPCDSVGDALSYANSIRKDRVHVYLMNSEVQYPCGMASYQGLKTVILESLDEVQTISCKGKALFNYLSLNTLKFSKLKLVDFTINSGDTTLVSVSMIEIENTFVNNSLIYEPSPQFGYISVSIAHSHLENIHFSATLGANFTDTTIVNVKHVQELPSLGPFTYINNCTINNYEFISTATESMYSLEPSFSLLNSRVKDSNFHIYRTLTCKISKNTFTGSIIISQSFLSSSNFESNRMESGTFQLSAYYIDALLIESNEFSNILRSEPVFEISNTLKTMFQLNTFTNVRNCVSVSQSNYIMIYQTYFTNTTISLRVDSLMDVVTSNVLLDGCIFTNNGDLTIPYGAFIKANSVTVTDSFFNGNKAIKGGGLYVEGGSIGLLLQAQNNTALMGGAIYAKLLGTVPLNLRVGANFNKAQLGGAIFVENPKPQVYLSYLNCNYNYAVFSGGCIYLSEAGSNVETGFLLKDHNEAGSYGDFIGEPLNNVTFTAQVVSSNDKVVIQSQNLVYSQYPGQDLTISIENLQTYMDNQRIPVKILENQVDIFVSVSDGIIYSKKFISNQLNTVSYSLTISEKDLKQVHGYITIQNIVQNITINILDCPKGKELLNPLSSGFICYDVKIDKSAEIIIPISVVLGILLMMMILILLILAFRVVRNIYLKLNRLKRKEIAEKNLEDKIIENSFYYDSLQPLIVNSDSSNSPQSLIIPIEEISIEKKIGEGSNGIVYLGKWKGKKIAIKALKSNLQDQEEVEDFEREASILNSLSHPNIVKFYGIAMSSTQKYMIVEYVSHGSLDRLIYKSRLGFSTLNLKQKLDILTSVANGMKYLHNLEPPIIHRDLKPGNILITDDYTGKVSDFGLSTPNYNASTKNIGTIFYLANEMVESGNYTTKVDVYSFSIIMWEIFFEEHCYYNSRCYKIHRFESSDSSNSMNDYNLLLNVLKGSRPKIPFSTEEERNIWLTEFMLPTENIPLETLSVITRKFIELMQRCWDKNPNARPSFSEIISEFIMLQSILK